MKYSNKSAKLAFFLRERQPPLIAAWGKNDPSFVWPGAEAFLRDDPNAEAHPIDGGHFALEAHWREIGQLILERWG